MKDVIVFRAKGEWRILSVGVCAAFLLGALICFLVVRLIPDPEVTSAFIATFLALFAGVMVVCILGGISMIGDFNLAVSMGHTRKRFIREEFLISTLLSLYMMLLTYALYLVDKWLLETVYADVMIDTDMDMRVFYGFLKNPCNFLFIVASVTALRFLIAVLQAAFGAKAWAAIYAVCMIVSLTSAKLGKLEHAGTLQEFSDRMMQINSNLANMAGGYFWQLIGILVSTCILVVCVQLVKRSQVRE